uniref:Uncharacterized protein n=1 Tax=Arundo donax TaxID=35708 RepID=A0A0A9BFC1_ARUDO
MHKQTELHDPCNVFPCVTLYGVALADHNTIWLNWASNEFILS